MFSPSAVSVASPPIAFMFPTSAARRSVSWPLRCAIPVKELGEFANNVIATRTGVNSPTSLKSKSIPFISPECVTFKPLSLRDTEAPIFVNISIHAFPACVVS
ncbi:unannotated protein [freshwater metagenome]|uniref:Unannotated protein n=1 Tax=freshwater metagenome TaxID=449393 RepID=A0A6J6EXZ4_9ZZZZ